MLALAAVSLNECRLEWDHNLDVSARMLQKRGNNFFDACNFKGLGVVKCGQKMAFSNLRAMKLLTVMKHIMGRIFFTAFNKLNGSQQNASCVAGQD